MVENGHLAIGLFDLEPSRGGLHPQGIVVCGVDNHGGRVVRVDQGV